MNPASDNITNSIVADLTSNINDVSALLASQDTETSLGNVLIYGAVLNEQTLESDTETLQNVNITLHASSAIYDALYVNQCLKT